MNATTTHPLPRRVSEIFSPDRWREVSGFPHAEAGTEPSQQQAQALTDITYHRGCVRDEHGTWLRDLPVVRVAFNRPEVRNAFRPRTVDELYRVLDHARMSGDVGAVILTGNGPSPRDGGWAFSSGGDQRIRGRDGYRYEREAAPQSPTAAGEPEDRAYSHEADVAAAQARLDTARAGRLHILEVQRLIRTMPKAVIAAVPGWAAGGGHSLNVVCDLSLASIEHARFKQTDADVGSFDAGYGSALLARQIGDKRAREIFFLARTYDAVTAERWGVVNEAVPHAELEERALERALAEVRRAVDQAAVQGVKTIQYVIDTSGAGMPYKHNPHTDARVHTGAMRGSVGARWEKDDPSGLAVFIGFVEGPDYTVFQEEGTRKLRAMASLAKARAIVEDALDSHGNLVEATK